MIKWSRKVITSVVYIIESEKGEKFKLTVNESTNDWFFSLSSSEQQMVLGMLVKRYLPGDEIQ